MSALSADAPEQQTTLLEDLKALLRCPRELWLVYLATLLEYVGVYSFLATLPLWLSSDHHMSDESAGWWAATFSTLISLFVVMVGSIADAVGIRRTLLLSFAFAAITRLAMSLAPTPSAAVVTLLAFGFAYATTAPVLQTSVQRASTKRTRAFAFSLWYMSLNIGGALSGPMIDVTRRFFLDPSTDKLAPRMVWIPLLGSRPMTANAAILGLGFLSAAAAVAVVALMRKGFEDREDPEEGPPPKVEKSSPWKALEEVFAHRAFWRFMLLLALISLVRMMFQHMHFTWPKYVTREQGDAFPVGTVWAINSVLVLVLVPLGTALTRKRRPLDVLLFGAFISAASPFVLCFGSSMPYQLAMILVLTVGEALWSPRLYEYNVSVAPRGRESTYVGLAALPYFLAKFLVGPTSGYLLAAYCPAEGPRQSALLWGIVGVTTMIGPVSIFLLRGWIGKKDEAPAAHRR